MLLVVRELLNVTVSVKLPDCYLLPRYLLYLTTETELRHIPDTEGAVSTRFYLEAGVVQSFSRRRGI